MSFALVETVPMYDTITGQGSKFKPELKAMTSACIVFTVFVLGGYTYYLLERLGIGFSGDGKDIDANSDSDIMEMESLTKASPSGDDNDKKSSPQISYSNESDTCRQRLTFNER